MVGTTVITTSTFDSTFIAELNANLTALANAISPNPQIVCDTLAVFRALTTTPDSVTIKGNLAINDGWGDAFVYDSSDTTSADDGASVLVLGTRRYKRRSRNLSIAWPSSFGSTPLSFSAINHGAYPTAGMIPAGVLQQNSAAMIVPVGYTQQPWPNVNFAAYLENQSNTVGTSAVNFFGIATSTGGANGSVYNFNSIISNAPAASVINGAGLGTNFNFLIGWELNPNIWKVGAASPTGTLYGIQFKGGGDSGAVPTNGAYGIFLSPLATNTGWTNFLRSDDAATAGVFASMGALTTGNGVASQSLEGRARSAGGANLTGYLRYLSSAHWFAQNGVMIGASEKALDAGALLQTYDSANALKISAVLRNDNSASPTVALGFNVAASSETSVAKGGIGFTRSGPQGAGYGSLYNRSSTDVNPFATTDEIVRWTTAGITIMPQLALPVGGAVGTGILFTNSGLAILIGSGAPTVSAPQGSLYLRSDGSTTATRLYVNTNGTTGWTNFTSAT